ncbi:MAG: hypothetical protein STHCBS139747_004627 [Sporothrix thermara]
MASEHLYNQHLGGYGDSSPASPENCQQVPCDYGHSNNGWAEWQPRRRHARRSHDSMYSGWGRPALSDCDEEEMELPNHYYAARHVPLDDFDEPFDPIGHLGEGIPPYNFDLFSEVSSTYAPDNNDPYTERSSARGDFYNDEDINRLFSRGGGGSFQDSYKYGEEDTLPPRGHRFGDDGPVIPDYNYDLFSDVTNRWESSQTAGWTSERWSDHDSGGASTGAHARVGKHTSAHVKDHSPQPSRQTSLVLRRQPPLEEGKDLRGAGGGSADGSSPLASAIAFSSFSGLCRASTLEVEEYNGTDDEETNSSDAGEGARTLVSTTQRMIDCEVISNPDEAERHGLRAQGRSFQCRASIRTFQAVRA